MYGYASRTPLEEPQSEVIKDFSWYRGLKRNKIQWKKCWLLPRDSVAEGLECPLLAFLPPVHQNET